MKRQRILIDTGPIVAILSKADQHHQHCVDELASLRRRSSPAGPSSPRLSGFYATTRLRSADCSEPSRPACSPCCPWTKRLCPGSTNSCTAIASLSPIWPTPASLSGRTRGHCHGIHPRPARLLRLSLRQNPPAQDHPRSRPLKRSVRIPLFSALQAAFNGLIE